MQHPFNCTFGELGLYLDLDKYLLFKSCHNLNIWRPYTAPKALDLFIVRLRRSVRCVSPSLFCG
jgi:hypothetical protein